MTILATLDGAALIVWSKERAAPSLCRLSGFLAPHHPLEAYFWCSVYQQGAEAKLRCVCRFATIRS